MPTFSFGVSAPQASSAAPVPALSVTAALSGSSRQPQESKADESKKRKVINRPTERRPFPHVGWQAPEPQAPPVTANNPFAKFMLKPGQWECPSCEVTNEASAIVCRACEVKKPVPGSSEESPAKKKKTEAATGGPSFSFGTPAGLQPPLTAPTDVAALTQIPPLWTQPSPSEPRRPQQSFRSEAPPT